MLIKSSFPRFASTRDSLLHRRRMRPQQ
jgi:hypothetical protein